MAIVKWKVEDWLVSKNWQSGTIRAVLHTVFDATQVAETNDPFFKILPGIRIDPIFDSNLWRLTLFKLGIDDGCTCLCQRNSRTD